MKLTENDGAAVQVTIQELYRTFARYPFRLKHYCPCCLEKSERQILSSTPLNLLTAEEVVPYTVSAMLTVGDAQDVKYFLPRLFELLVVQDRWPGTPRFLDMLVRADWSHWPPAEQRAVREALLTHWDALLTASVPSFEVIGYINAIAHGEESLDLFLQQWQQRACVPLSPALDHLACWIVDHPSLALGHVERYPSPQEAQILLWLLDWQELELLFIQSFVEAQQRPPDTQAQETMQNADSALQLLGWLKQAWSERQHLHP